MRWNAAGAEEICNNGSMWASTPTSAVRIWKKPSQAARRSHEDGKKPPHDPMKWSWGGKEQQRNGQNPACDPTQWSQAGKEKPGLEEKKPRLRGFVPARSVSTRSRARDMEFAATRASTPTGAVEIGRKPSQAASPPALPQGEPRARQAAPGRCGHRPLRVRWRFVTTGRCGHRPLRVQRKPGRKPSQAASPPALPKGEPRWGAVENNRCGGNLTRADPFRRPRAGRAFAESRPFHTRPCRRSRPSPARPRRSRRSPGNTQASFPQRPALRRQR